jgi:ABC-type cobalamin/Fe3+-siderophores transport system ATPase subunit
LNDISLSIKSGEKIAICGPSGSGKSSLILSLFQMVDVRHGQIIIDGRDISEMNSEDVRSRMNVIPQEAFFMPELSVSTSIPAKRQVMRTSRAPFEKSGFGSEYSPMVAYRWNLIALTGRSGSVNYSPLPGLWSPRARS